MFNHFIDKWKPGKTEEDNAFVESWIFSSLQVNKTVIKQENTEDLDMKVSSNFHDISN